jgi:DNA-binding response OmpR family regulator
VRGIRPEILLVDDDADSLEMLDFVLGHDYVIHHAEDIRSAVQLLEPDRFDLIILDTHLPDGSGIDLLKKIREIDPKAPVIFVSADARLRISEEALGFGAEEYFSKPLDLAQFEIKVSRWLRKRS